MSGRGEGLGARGFCCSIQIALRLKIFGFRGSSSSILTLRLWEFGGWLGTELFVAGSLVMQSG